MKVRDIILDYLWTCRQHKSYIRNSDMVDVAMHGRTFQEWHNPSTYEREFRRMRSEQPIRYTPDERNAPVEFRFIEVEQEGSSQIHWKIQIRHAQRQFSL